LEEAVTAYRDALKERTREREPVDWAITTGSQGEALILLAKRRVDAAMAKTAVAQIEAARDLMQAAGHAPFTAHYQAKLVRGRAAANKIRGRCIPTPLFPSGTNAPRLSARLTARFGQKADKFASRGVLRVFTQTQNRGVGWAAARHSFVLSISRSLLGFK